ncbi:WD repeat-containing protein 18 [Entophlyctis luteolus]|nr:WD repeat-containing protein 18 [Entophlyctis luteolus]
MRSDAAATARSHTASVGGRLAGTDAASAAATVGAAVPRQDRAGDKLTRPQSHVAARPRDTVETFVAAFIPANSTSSTSTSSSSAPYPAALSVFALPDHASPTPPTVFKASQDGTVSSTSANLLSLPLAASTVAGILRPHPSKPIVLHWAWRSPNAPATKLAVPEPISALQISHDALWVAAGSNSGRVYVWSLSNGDMVAMFDAHFKPVRVLSFSSDDASIVTAGDDAFAHVWLLGRAMSRSASASPYCTMTGHSLPITDAAFSTVNPFRSSKLFTSSLDHTLKVWDSTTGNPLYTITFPRAILCLAVDPLEMFVCAGASDGNIYYCDLYKSNSTTMSAEDEMVEGGTIQQLIVSLDRGIEPLTEGDMITSDTGSAFRGHRGPVTSIAISHSATHLTSGARDGSVMVWEVATRQHLRTHHLNALSGATSTGAASSHSSSNASGGSAGVTRVCAIRRPRGDGAGHKAGLGVDFKMPVWKRFVDEGREDSSAIIPLSLTQVSGGGGGDALDSVWKLLGVESEIGDDIDDMDFEFAVTPGLTAYNPARWDNPANIATRMLQVIAGSASESSSETTNGAENTEEPQSDTPSAAVGADVHAELERLRAEVQRLSDHNRSLRALNDELYDASSKNMIGSLKEQRKKFKTKK